MRRDRTWLAEARPSAPAGPDHRLAIGHCVARRRARRPLLLGLAWCGVWACSAGLWHAYGPPLLLNLTPSVPRGVYRLTPLPTLHHGLLVTFPPPPPVAALAVSRGYLAPHMPLLKPVAALPGETVCVHDNGVVIQGHWVAPVASTDTRGRPLPRWRGCVTLGPGEVLPLSPAPHSFDGRYFGPVAVTSLLGQAVPVWTWGVGGVRDGEGERGQDKGTPYSAPLPQQKQPLGTRQAQNFPAHSRNALGLPPLTPRHDAVAGEEDLHGAR